jgi:hypothetical protein
MSAFMTKPSSLSVRLSMPCLNYAVAWIWKESLIEVAVCKDAKATVYTLITPTCGHACEQSRVSYSSLLHDYTHLQLEYMYLTM